MYQVLDRPLYPAVSDMDFVPCGEPGNLQLEVYGRPVVFREVVYPDSRVITLAAWPNWVHDLDLFGLMIALFRGTEMEVVELTVTKTGEYTTVNRKDPSTRTQHRHEIDAARAARELLANATRWF